MWIYLNKNPLGKHTGDCVVRACSFAIGQSWDKTYRELCEKGYSLAEMPSWNNVWWSYLKDKGFSRHIIPDTCPDCYTVNDFCRDHPQGTFVLFIPHSSEGSGHAVAVKDGDVYDTGDSTSQSPLAYWRKER